jgi:hypothetical protein
MDTKIIHLLVLALLLLSCDPDSVEKSFTVKNNSNSDIDVLLYQNGENRNLNNFSNSETEIKQVSGLGTGGFGDIGIYDSIKLKITSNMKSIIWINPGGVGYIDVDNNIGTERDVLKDIYNRRNWTFQTNGDDEVWIFTINESDLDLFE